MLLSCRPHAEEQGMSMNPTCVYDVIVIGAGIAGMVAAVTASGLGKRVAVIEKNKGCL